MVQVSEMAARLLRAWVAPCSVVRVGAAQVRPAKAARTTLVNFILADGYLSSGFYLFICAWLKMSVRCAEPVQTRKRMNV